MEKLHEMPGELRLRCLKKSCRGSSLHRPPLHGGCRASGHGRRGTRPGAYTASSPAILGGWGRPLLSLGMSSVQQLDHARVLDLWAANFVCC